MIREIRCALRNCRIFCEPEEVDEVAPVSWTSVTAKQVIPTEP